jgi:branched-chain amino acid transport system substrate-binding protein
MCWASLLIPAALAAQIKFGATVRLTGSGAAFGKNTWEGMELARHEVNAEGGIRGQELGIIYEDIGEINLKQAVSAAQKLISVDKVLVLLPMVTEDSEVIWPIAVKRNILTLAIYAGGKDLTAHKKLMFQVSSSDEVLVNSVLGYAKQRNVKALCILSEQGAYALPLAKFAAQQWQASPGNSVSFVDTPETSDFKPILVKLRSSGCSALALFTSPNIQGSVQSQIQQIGWRVLRLGLDTSKDENALKIAGRAADGLVYAKYLVSTPEFADKFRRRFGHEVGLPAALAYDAIKVLALVINQRGLKSEDIGQGLQTLRAYQGASGPITFGSDGTRQDREAQIWRIENGKALRVN